MPLCLLLIVLSFVCQSTCQITSSTNQDLSSISTSASATETTSKASWTTATHKPTMVTSTQTTLTTSTHKSEIGSTTTSSESKGLKEWEIVLIVAGCVVIVGILIIVIVLLVRRYNRKKKERSKQLSVDLSANKDDKKEPQYVELSFWREDDISKPSVRKAPVEPPLPPCVSEEESQIPEIPSEKTQRSDQGVSVTIGTATDELISPTTATGAELGETQSKMQPSITLAEQQRPSSMTQ